MEFALSSHQQMLQAELRDVLSNAAPLEVIRRIAADDTRALAGLAEALDAFGLGALAVPEAQGGLGLGLLEACLAQEVLGYACAPSRLIADIVAAKVLAQFPERLEALAAGVQRFGLAITELASRRDGAGLAISGSGISGLTLLVQCADGATSLVAADNGGGLCLVPAASATQARMRTIDRTRTFHEVQFQDAPIELILDGVAARQALMTARLLIAADTLGAAQAMLDKAVSYAKERQQFGRAIGSFQAVKHLCADMAARLEPGRALLWHAAHALDTQDPEGPLLALLAKSYLSEAGTFIARTATEVHGGMGFTDLLGLHFWFKRIGVNRQLFGSPEAIREEAALLQGFNENTTKTRKIA